MAKRTTTTSEYDSEGRLVKEVVVEEEDVIPHYCNCNHWHWYWYNNPYVAPVTAGHPNAYTNTLQITTGVPPT